MHAIITALILPIPLYHLWIHALLPFWRKHPKLLYVLGIAGWIFLIRSIPAVTVFSPVLFAPSPTLTSVGIGLMIGGLVMAVSSFITLGPRRFFAYEVLRPSALSQTRVAAGPFRWVPHPAYLGYCFVAIGNLLSSGALYLVGVLLYLLTITPIAIKFEEEELHKRIPHS